jgi:hypothetical protein
MTALEPGADGRGPDRRHRPTPIVSRWTFRGGRRGTGGRRPGENERAFVDLYPPRDAAILVAFLFLNLLDAYFTLVYLQRGGEEANPVAVGLLHLGMESFIFLKGLGITAGAVFFCLLRNWRNARRGVLLVLFFYQLLFVYHLLLYTNSIGDVMP